MRWRKREEALPTPTIEPRPWERADLWLPLNRAAEHTGHTQERIQHLAEADAIQTQTAPNGDIYFSKRDLENNLEPEKQMTRAGLSDKWTISENAVGFVGEYSEGGPIITALSGATKEILLQRIEAWERERVINGRAA